MIKIETDSVSKKFGPLLILRDISFNLGSGDSFYITGPNGSGKSTLLQIISGLQRPTKGRVSINFQGKPVPPELYYRHLGYTGPLVNPYDMLTASENIRFAAEPGSGEERINSLLDRFGIYNHRNRQVRFYSSGMKQRLKLILAFLNERPALLLDEPGSNLDHEGKDILYSYIDELKKKFLIIIATNENSEINLCSRGIELGRQNP